MFIRKVKVENGVVCGLPAADPRITSYKGIPFAAPPVGRNRWRAPQPCADWQGEYRAYDFAPISMQWKPVIDVNNVYTREWAVDPDIAMDEDCLYLNIWAPADGRRDMPVFVWFFGGALRVGHTAEMEFDGERLARRGIVVVTVNYRVNSFGFLSHPEITAEAPEAPANFGFLDQQFATRWVKRNIAAFGGDPDNITIGGQSAGGMSVSAQMCYGGNEGLFKRAIIMSGMFMPAYGKIRRLSMTLEEGEEQGRRFFEYLGVKTLAEAREIDAVTLRDKTEEWEDKRWGEVIDGVFSKGDSGMWYTRPDRVKCPVMLGHTNNEFIDEPPAENEAQLRAFAAEEYGDRAEQYLSLFGGDMTADGIRKGGSVNCIELAIRLANEAVAGGKDPQPLYYYSFEEDIPGWDNVGAFHSVDLWFFFETLAKCWRPFTGRHYDLARRMCDYWAAFMRTGDPNGVDSIGEPLPLWTPVKPDALVRMRFADNVAPVGCEPSGMMKFLMEHFKSFGKNVD